MILSTFFENVRFGSHTNCTGLVPGMAARPLSHTHTHTHTHTRQTHTYAVSTKTTYQTCAAAPSSSCTPSQRKLNHRLPAVCFPGSKGCIKRDFCMFVCVRVCVCVCARARDRDSNNSGKSSSNVVHQQMSDDIIKNNRIIARYDRAVRVLYNITVEMCRI